MVRAIFSWVVVLFFSLSLQAQNGTDRDLYPERLHSDIELLRTALHEAHPDPYRYHTKAELNELIDDMIAAIDRPMNIVEFQQALFPILKAVGDAHCIAQWPTDYAEYLRTKALLIPLQVRILPEGVYVEDELKGFRSIPLGSRIVAINGRPIEEIMDRLLAMVVTDGANRTYAERLVEQEFPQRYHTFIEHAAAYRVTYMTPAKTEGVQTVFAMSGDDIARTRKPAGASLLPWGAQLEAESGTMWVTLRTLEPDSLIQAGQRADRFLQAMLAEADKNKARTMVLDLRGAGGRELAVAEMVFAAIAKTPFQVLSDMVVRSISPPEERASLSVPEDFYASSDLRFLPNAQGAYRLPPNDPRLAEHAPSEKGFQGKVYVVCDGMTRDAAAALVMMARRSRRARVVGEETGSNAFGFTGGPEWIVTGPGSGMRFHIPLLKYVPAGRGEGPMDRGEQPNHQAYSTPGATAQGRDPIRSALLEMIRELE